MSPAPRRSSHVPRPSHARPTSLVPSPASQPCARPTSLVPCPASQPCARPTSLVPCPTSLFSVQLPTLMGNTALIQARHNLFVRRQTGIYFTGHSRRSDFLRAPWPSILLRQGYGGQGRSALPRRGYVSPRARWRRRVSPPYQTIATPSHGHGGAFFHGHIVRALAKPPPFQFYFRLFSV